MRVWARGSMQRHLCGLLRGSLLVDDTSWIGYAQLMLKSDYELASVRLHVWSLYGNIEETGLRQYFLDNPLGYDPQANGAGESAVKA